jgi:hypothetical protein
MIAPTRLPGRPLPAETRRKFWSLIVDLVAGSVMVASAPSLAG